MEEFSGVRLLGVKVRFLDVDVWILLDFGC